MNPLGELEKAAALQMLDYLYDAKEALRTEIERNVQGSSGTIGSTLDVLNELGLLEERREPPQKRYVSLSPLGKEVAAHVRSIKNTLEKSA